MFSKLKELTKKAGVAIVAGATALASTALTISNGLVTFDTADNTAMSTATSNSLSNLWSGFMFVLPYIGIAVGVILVFAIGRKLLKGR